MLSLVEGFGNEVRIAGSVGEQQDPDEAIVDMKIKRIRETMKEDTTKSPKHAAMEQWIPPGRKDGCLQRPDKVVSQPGARLIVPNKRLVGVVHQPRVDFQVTAHRRAANRFWNSAHVRSNPGCASDSA